eukprot:1535492-Pyramimonas_sp.AAC.1
MGLAPPTLLGQQEVHHVAQLGRPPGCARHVCDEGCQEVQPFVPQADEPPGVPVVDPDPRVLWEGLAYGPD